MDHILTKYPDRVPVYIGKAERASSDLAELEKHKYLVPKTMTMGEFMCIVRRHINVNSHQAIFCFVNKSILAPNSMTMNELYEVYQSNDRMLYLEYMSENTFG